MSHGVALFTDSGRMQFFSEQEMRQYLSGGGSTGSLTQIAEQSYTNLVSGAVSAPVAEQYREDVNTAIQADSFGQSGDSWPSLVLAPLEEDWGTPEEPDDPEPYGPAYYGPAAGGTGPVPITSPQYTGQQPTLGAGAGGWFSRLSGFDALLGSVQNVNVQVDYWKEVIRYGQYSGGIENTQPRSFGGPEGNYYESLMDDGDNEIAKRLGFEYRRRN